MIVRTSDSDPIRVDFLPVEAGFGSGRLGMTFAPGKKAPGISGHWERDLDADLARLVDRYGARVLVSLLEPGEYEALGIVDLDAAAARYGLKFLSFPIPDGGVPPSINDAMAFVPRILDHLRTTGTVVVHCKGGLGRTGLIAACCLTAVDHEAAPSIAMVRTARLGAIENSRQEQFIAAFAAEWNRIERAPDG